MTWYCCGEIIRRGFLCFYWLNDFNFKTKLLFWPVQCSKTDKDHLILGREHFLKNCLRPSEQNRKCYYTRIFLKFIQIEIFKCIKEKNKSIKKSGIKRWNKELEVFWRVGIITFLILFFRSKYQIKNIIWVDYKKLDFFFFATILRTFCYNAEETAN